ncbi:MAG: hypothetical protein AB7I50_13075 [Vicinamibacterales bacterium]
MKTVFNRGVAVAVIHVALVAGLGGKLLFDRSTRPRVWARTAPVDPDLPIRGRYVSLRIEADIMPGSDFDAQPNSTTEGRFRTYPVALSARDGRLVASPAAGGAVRGRPVMRDGQRVIVLDEPVAYFIPEHATDPSRLSPGEELWAEVTLPRAGPPRPIQLGIKRAGQLAPLALE